MQRNTRPSLDAIEYATRDGERRGGFRFNGSLIIDRIQRPRSGLVEKSNGAAEIVAVIRLVDDALPVQRHHVRAGLGAEAVQMHTPSVSLDGDHVLLTRFRVQAGLRIIVEERVQPTAVHENVVGVDNTQTPRLAARVGGAGAECRIVERGVGGEGVQGVRV